MPTNMPGGKIIVGMGGHVVPIDPVTGVMTHVDVASWDLERENKTAKCGHSGTLQAIGRRVTGFDWKANLRLWWDLDKPPQILLFPQGGWGCGIQLGLGSQAGQASYGYAVQQFYYSPSCMMTYLKVHDSSEGDEVVTADATLEGNSRIFLLPNEQAAYAIYAAQLSALGQFVPLAQFAIMQP